MSEVSDLHARLRQRFPTAKPATLRQMLRDGRVRVNGVVARRLDAPLGPADELEVGETVRVAAKPQFRPMLQPLTLILDDPDFLVVDKPAGLLTSTVPTEKRPTAWAKVQRHLEHNEPGARPGLVHRLDRDASGLLVFSKNPAAYESLKEQFFRHTVERVYVAVTHGVPTPAEGRITSLLVELPDGKVRTSRKPNVGQKAVTDYKTIERGGGLAGLRVQLDTGRKHQIRAHLSERGVPIVGDRMYGKPGDGAPRLMLAAVRLGFTHPRTGRPVLAEIAVPREFPLVGG
jgi:23S rRNA pseudouridine1911/1915/1917 synthase